MSKQEKEVYLKIMRHRYSKMRTKKARGQVLDEFCKVTELSRKHSIKMLSTKKAPPKRRGRPHGGTPEGTELLIRLWRLSDMLCGKLLVVAIPELLRSLQRHETVCDLAVAEVSNMSASTIDRRLCPVKAADPSRGKRRRSSLEAHRREIPLKIDTWPEKGPETPGYLEIDTVAHCGGSMSGSFVWTLTVTDVRTQWTELRSIWNKGAVAVCDALEDTIKKLTFPVVFINSDNGGEVINGHINRHFSKYRPDIRRTRSRSYIKNDNPHVEQKNGALVRSLYGYGRIEDPALLKIMNEINLLQGKIKNLYTPTMRLLKKERIGAKWVKRFEKTPKTPAQRILESDYVSEENKQKVIDMLQENDYIEIVSSLQKKIKKLAKFLAPPAPRGAGMKGIRKAQRTSSNDKKQSKQKSFSAA